MFHQSDICSQQVRSIQHFLLSSLILVGHNQVQVICNLNGKRVAGVSLLQLVCTDKHIIVGCQRQVVITCNGGCAVCQVKGHRDPLGAVLGVGVLLGSNRSFLFVHSDQLIIIARHLICIGLICIQIAGGNDLNLLFTQRITKVFLDENTQGDRVLRFHRMYMGGRKDTNIRSGQ